MSSKVVALVPAPILVRVVTKLATEEQCQVVWFRQTTAEPAERCINPTRTRVNSANMCVDCLRRLNTKNPAYSKAYTQALVDLCNEIDPDEEVANG